MHAAATGSGFDVDPNVRAVLEEVGIDAADAFTRPLSAEVLGGADVIVTMGRSVGDVSIPEHVRHIDWRVGDPAGAELDEVRRVLDDLFEHRRRFIDLAMVSKYRRQKCRIEKSTALVTFAHFK